MDVFWVNIQALRPVILVLLPNMLIVLWEIHHRYVSRVQLMEPIPNKDSHRACAAQREHSPLL